MAPATTRNSTSPEPLASLPPSPVEEDIGGASDAWHHETTSTSGSTLADDAGLPRNKGKGKNKGKQRDRSRSEGPYRDDGEESHDSEEGDAVEGYPPAKEDEAESRRVEENLRRWEMAERQRRKAARESQLSTTTNNSVVGDVTRKASLLWPGRRYRRPSMDGAGSHHVLQQSNDEGVALNELDTRLTTSPKPDESQNPFRTPNLSTTSLNTPYDSAVMTASSATPDDDLTPHATEHRPILESSNSHPPPAPLDLPAPRSPPPRTLTPHANRPPEPVPPPTVSPMSDVEDVPFEKSQWWTDWLCGCSDKGDNQAARTNPFE